MARSERYGRWRGILAAAVACATLALVLAACAGPAAAPTADAGLAGLARNVDTLNQQVAAQATRIASLEAQAELLQQLEPQATRIGALETQIAVVQTAAVPTATSTAQPTPTMIPAVAGLVTDGNTKGPANAKVTITEYVDYF
jgi:protein-disulfide isomerase